MASSTLGSVAAGHHLVQGNYEGIHTFQHPDFQRELSCLLGEDTSRAACCPRPDIVLINSGMHDARRGGNSTFAYIFEGRVAQLATRLRELVYQSVGKTKVFWVGSNSFRAFAEFPHVEVMALDAIARRYMTANDLPVIAVADMMQRLLPFGTNVSGFSTDTIHWGPVAYYFSEEVRVTISTMLLQVIMGELCA